MSRSNSKSKKPRHWGRSKVEDVVRGEKFKTSTLGEIVSLEKSKKECHRSLNNNILPVEVSLVIVISLKGFVSCSFGWPENNTDDRYLVGHRRLPLGLRLGLSFLPTRIRIRIKWYQSSGYLKMSGNEDHHRQGRRFAAGGNGHNGRDPHDVEIKRLHQRVRDLEIQHEIRQIRKRIRELELQRDFVSCSFGWPENNTDDRYLVGHGRLPLGLRLGTRSLRVSKPKKHDTLQSTWKTMTDKDVRDQEEAHRKQFEQESERLFGQREAANTNNTNILNAISSPVNVVSSSFTIVNPGKERAQMNEFESVFGLDKDANDNSMFTPVGAVGSTYVYLSRSIPVDATTLLNADLPIDPLMPDLEDTVDTRIFDDREVSAEADTNNLALSTVMYVKSAFLYGTIKEEVYVSQPLGFEDPHFSDKVYKVEKPLYGLHQAPRAWYETLPTKLLENGFRRGTIDKTLFIKKDKEIPNEFYGEITFFLGFQVKQKDDRIFISQDKYVDDILKKFDFTTVKTASTLIETNKALLKDEEAQYMDVHLYKLMIGSLMYLTTSRIFRYLKGQPKLGLWYPKDSPFDLEAF
nr:hypothetical protein [Tanacetum cinerariifolium]